MGRQMKVNKARPEKIILVVVGGGERKNFGRRER
jgi:hypothetical protein